ncbi:cytochrome P450 3A5-like, partial [Aplysia californica]|uniref:Cytochrome P450 3A5-like n=1 Tax=Aplysia californica TaxID=6500 RepID=A0ABM1ACV0_APLCA
PMLLTLPAVGLSGFLLFLCLLLVGFYLYCNGWTNVWVAVGVPGPRPWPFLLHVPEMMSGGLEQALEKWESVYGRTYGLHSLINRRPTLVTSDTRLLTRILAEDFPNFLNRSPITFTNSTSLSSLFFSGGCDWRRAHHVMSPIFTGRKLRVMMRDVNDSAACLVALVEGTRRRGDLVPLKKFMAKYTSDVIAKLGFGLRAKAVSGVDNEFFHNINNFLNIGTASQNLLRLVALYFPALAKIGLDLFPSSDVINPKADAYFTRLARDALRKKREQKASEPRDMLDLLLQSETRQSTPGPSDKALTSQEIVANSVLLILSAFETTSSTLRAVLYLLARHPDIQDKVIQEVDTVLQGRRQPQYEDLASLKYTEQVIKETLRLFPPAPAVTRQAEQTMRCGDVTIPKDSCVYIRINRVLRDPGYWRDPDSFDPDRFSPGAGQTNTSDGIEFLVFGFGPRQCIGRRLAFLELKVVLCQLLTTFSHISPHISHHRWCCVNS